MRKAFMLVAIQCHGCGSAGPVVPPRMYLSENLLIKDAVEAHKASGVICPTPGLVLIYNNCLISNSIKIETEPRIVSSNGNGHVKQNQQVEETPADILGDSSLEEAGEKSQ